MLWPVLFMDVCVLFLCTEYYSTIIQKDLSRNHSMADLTFKQKVARFETVDPSRIVKDEVEK